jgi:hypothetical protein
MPATGWMTGNQLPVEVKIFPFATAFRLALGHTQFPLHCLCLLRHFPGGKAAKD